MRELSIVPKLKKKINFIYFLLITTLEVLVGRVSLHLI